MKRILAMLALACIATSALAQARPSTVNRPCASSRQLVFSQGAIVLSTGPNTYDRYVRDLSFCEPNQYLSPAVVPAFDTPQCPVGYRCKDGPRDFFDN
jgi:hypothetical protein